MVCAVCIDLGQGCPDPVLGGCSLAGFYVLPGRNYFYPRKGDPGYNVKKALFVG